MSSFKELKQEEVPEEYRHLVVWDQPQEPVFSVAGGKNYLEVWVVCQKCEQPRQIAVNSVRSWCRGQKRSKFFPGTHRGCRFSKRVIDGQGYARVYVGYDFDRERSLYRPEHRVVMEETLGRPLTDDETVHHINGDRQDNRPENLQLRTGRHGNGIVNECGDCHSRNIVAVML